MEQLLNHTDRYLPLGAAARQALEAVFEKTILPKNDYLLRSGKICRHLYFMEKGALRGYYTLDDKEVTHWFGFENDFITSFHSFISEEPAVENIQLLEGSILWSISKEQLFLLFDRFPEIERLVRIVTEKYYIRLEERFVNAQFRTAKERYERMLHDTAHILERVPLGYIASYLGISQETLSRIRSQL